MNIPYTLLFLTLHPGKLYINRILLFGFRGFAKDGAGSQDISSLNSIPVGETVTW